MTVFQPALFYALLEYPKLLGGLARLAITAEPRVICNAEGHANDTKLAMVLLATILTNTVISVATAKSIALGPTKMYPATMRLNCKTRKAKTVHLNLQVARAE